MSGPRANDVPSSPIEVTLALRPDAKGALLADLVFTNRSAHPYRLLKWLTFPGGEIDSESFDVRVDGKPASYIGMMLKRAAPGPDDFGLLQPGYVIASTAILTEAYDIAHGHELSVAYDDINPPFGERRHGDRLRSNTVILRR